MNVDKLGRRRFSNPEFSVKHSISLTQPCPLEGRIGMTKEEMELKPPIMRRMMESPYRSDWSMFEEYWVERTSSRLQYTQKPWRRIEISFGAKLEQK